MIKKTISKIFVLLFLVFHCNSSNAMIGRFLFAISKKIPLVAHFTDTEEYITKLCKHGYTQEAKDQIEEHCSNEPRWYFTCLKIAILEGSLEIVKWLVEDKKISMTLPYTYHSGLYFACKSGNLEIVKYLIEDRNNDPNAVYTFPFPNGGGLNLLATPLITACIYNKLNIVRYLIQRGANANIGFSLSRDDQCYRDDNSQHHPYYWESPILDFYPNSTKVFHLKGFLGANLFHIACELGRKEIAEWLLQNRHIDVDVEDYFGHTGIFYACLNNQTDMLKWLVTQKNVDINKRNKADYHIIHFACHFSEIKPEIVSWLLEYEEIDPDLETKDGNTPLMILMRDLSLRMENDTRKQELIEKKGAITPITENFAHICTQINSRLRSQNKFPLKDLQKLISGISFETAILREELGDLLIYIIDNNIIDKNGDTIGSWISKFRNKHIPKKIAKLIAQKKMFKTPKYQDIRICIN